MHSLQKKTPLLVVNGGAWWCMVMYDECRVMPCGCMAMDGGAASRSMQSLMNGSYLSAVGALLFQCPCGSMHARM